MFFKIYLYVLMISSNASNDIKFVDITPRMFGRERIEWHGDSFQMYIVLVHVHSLLNVNVAKD